MQIDTNKKPFLTHEQYEELRRDLFNPDASGQYIGDIISPPPGVGGDYFCKLRDPALLQIYETAQKTLIGDCGKINFSAEIWGVVEKILKSPDSFPVVEENIRVADLHDSEMMVCYCRDGHLIQILRLYENSERTIQEVKIY